MDFESAVEYLEQFVSYEKVVNIPYGKKAFNLERLKDFLTDFGLDYSRVRFVQVAGSKGKGSVSNILARCLWKSDFKVGLFTSPHFIDLRERFWLNGKLITKARFAKYVKKLSNFNCELTYFDLLTIIALQFFIEEKVDYAVLEVGLGGRLDSTSVVKPELGILTRVEEEHLGILGDNLEEILNEKLGILKKDMSLLVGDQSKAVYSLLEKKLTRKQEIFFVKNFIENIKLNLKDMDAAKLENAKTVFCALKILLGSFPEIEFFQENVENSKLMGRFDVRKIKGKTAVFDMAHTENSIGNLVKSLQEKFPKKSFRFLVSIMKGKNVREMLKLIEALSSEIIFTSSHPIRGFTAKELAKLWQKNSEIEEDCLRAFKNSLKNLKKDQVLVVTGSHFLVAKVLAELKTKQ